MALQRVGELVRRRFVPDQHSDLSYGAAMRSPNKDAFQLAYDAEMIRQIEDYKCLVAVDKVPAGKQVVSYANPRFKTKTGEADQTTYHCRQTFGGDKASTGDFTYSSTSTMEEVKMFLVGAVSDNANLSAIDITAFFLNNPHQQRQAFAGRKDCALTSTTTESQHSASYPVTCKFRHTRMHPS